ncbi:hypothetical protein OHA21_07760 [Actinoplanes sp. NBC_00393]|uniref:hypothetical protein n=1 Tax=Actinoplanes sp. NBC_00393 TaxID=2975953 RepID=UPI002E1FBD28
MPVDYLTVQNEPQNRHPSGYPGTDLPVRQAVPVSTALGRLRPATARRPITHAVCSPGGALATFTGPAARGSLLIGFA